MFSWGEAGVASQVFVRYILSGWGSLRQGRYGQLWSFGVGFVWVRQVRCVTDWLGRVTSRSGESRQGRQGELCFFALS